MNNLEQFGIAGVALAILSGALGVLYFIVKYFVQAMTKKDDVILKQHEELKDLTIRGIETQNKFTESVNINTKTTKDSSDQLTKMIFELIKSK